MGGNAGDTAMLDCNFPAGVNDARMYDIKVSQIPCGSNFS